MEFRFKTVRPSEDSKQPVAKQPEVDSAPIPAAVPAAVVPIAPGDAKSEGKRRPGVERRRAANKAYEAERARLRALPVEELLNEVALKCEAVAVVGLKLHHNGKDVEEQLFYTLKGGPVVLGSLMPAVTGLIRGKYVSRGLHLNGRSRIHDSLEKLSHPSALAVDALCEKLDGVAVVVYEPTAENDDFRFRCKHTALRAGMADALERHWPRLVAECCKPRVFSVTICEEDDQEPAERPVAIGAGDGDADLKPCFQHEWRERNNGRGEWCVKCGEVRPLATA